MTFNKSIRIGLLVLSCLLFIAIVFSFKSFESKVKVKLSDKHKGAHVFRMKGAEDLKNLEQLNLEWITMVSWGYQDDIDCPEIVHHQNDSLQILKYNQHWIDRIKGVREAGYKVFFKPHIWLLEPQEGKWRSDILMTHEADREEWEINYSDFILRYAKVAEEAGAEMFCIGMEFSLLTEHRPDFWSRLIKDVRSVYSGQITYAANWYKEYEELSFWNELDYIGIQAYFPLSKKRNPSTKELSKAWKKYLKAMKKVSDDFQKPVLFTEMGYRSISTSAIRPWEWAENTRDEDHPYSEETQANCYSAFFDSVWKEDWFAGIHLWQLRADYKPREGRQDLNFTPQFKKAEKVISNAFSPD